MESGRPSRVVNTASLLHVVLSNFLRSLETPNTLTTRSTSLVQLYFLPERALHDNASPCLFWLVCLPEHSTVRCAGGCRDERAHRLMASMGLSRLDDLSLWTQYSRTAGDRASSSSLTSPRLLQVFLAIAFRLYSGRALSLAPVVESIFFRPPACRFGQIRVCTWPLHQFSYLERVGSLDAEAHLWIPAGTGSSCQTQLSDDHVVPFETIDNA